jgi:hypothetical protein
VLIGFIWFSSGFEVVNTLHFPTVRLYPTNKSFGKAIIITHFSVCARVGAQTRGRVHERARM